MDHISGKWQTSEQLENVLYELVSWRSETGTKGEKDFAYKFKDKLEELDYFINHPSHIKMHDAGKGRHAVTALYKQENIKQTIVLISHFDTVHTASFGVNWQLAFQPHKLKQHFQKAIHELPTEVQEDVKSGAYVFGRGIMDMKMGIVLHMHLLECAIREKWSLNIILLTVPDEEVGSSGMRTAANHLVKLQSTYDLMYSLFLNSEPSFTQTPNDPNYYIYSGSIGKIMPGALFYGVETHAGEPLSGINAHYMASFLTNEMEYNGKFMEQHGDERTPRPVCLKIYDLKKEYSTQTSTHVAALYNVFIMKQSATEIMNQFKTIASEAMLKCQETYEAICKQEGVPPISPIQILTYEELVNYASEKLGNAKINQLHHEVLSNTEADEREIAVHMTDVLIAACQELAPATILFYAPSYYPAVNSSDSPVIQDKIMLTQQLLKREFNVEAKQIHYFNGISDLSYVNYDQEDGSWKAFKANSPTPESIYNIPFRAMQQLEAPVLNIGPYGKDAHKLTERLHKKSAFIVTPYILRRLMKSFVVS